MLYKYLKVLPAREESNFTNYLSRFNHLRKAEAKLPAKFPAAAVGLETALSWTRSG
jgi:hypothetical protein